MTYRQVLSHRLELVKRIRIVVILLPFPFQQTQRLLEHGQRSDISRGWFLGFSLAWAERLAARTLVRRKYDFSSFWFVPLIVNRSQSTTFWHQL